MKIAQPQKINTVTEYHQYMGLNKPEHPLISVIDFSDIQHLHGRKSINIILGFYSISLKHGFTGSARYGQQMYDFDAGVMAFMSPGQLLRIEAAERLQHTGYLLLVHPDFLWHTPLAKSITQYEYFGYAVNEALHLSQKEETAVSGIFQNITQEYRSAIDKFSQAVMIAQIGLLLTYAERFYQRQFITRTPSTHTILDRLETILADCFDDENLVTNGLPSVQLISEALNVTPNYLSSMLKVLTGRSTQQHIHDKLIAKAKEKLSTTHLSVSEIAYELGFGHSQSFSKLFKSKTSLSPTDFRSSFN